MTRITPEVLERIKDAADGAKVRVLSASGKLSIDDFLTLDELRAIVEAWSPTPPTTDLLAQIGEWAERLANIEAAATLPLPASIHVEGLKGGVSSTLAEMKVLLDAHGQEVPR